MTNSITRHTNSPTIAVGLFSPAQEIDQLLNLNERLQAAIRNIPSAEAKAGAESKPQPPETKPQSSRPVSPQ